MYYIIRYRLKGEKGSSWLTFPDRDDMEEKKYDLLENHEIAAMTCGFVTVTEHVT